MKKIAAIYIRVSTDKQSSGLEAQLRAIEAHCLSRQIGPYQVFSDEGISGARASRPSLNALMEAVGRGEVSTVIVWSFSRFARSTKHLLQALETFQNNSVSFVSLTEQLDTGTPTGRAFFTIIAALSELERELIRERVRNGLQNARAKGKRIGAPKRHADKLGMVCHLASQKRSHREIARIVGISQATVCRMLKAADSQTAA